MLVKGALSLSRIFFKQCCSFNKAQREKIVFSLTRTLEIEGVLVNPDECVYKDNNNGTVSDWNMHRGNLQRTGYSDVVYGIIAGDINSDGLVDVLDIMTTANIIMTFAVPTPYQQASCDLNVDGNIDIFDIILMIHLILQL